MIIDYLAIIPARSGSKGLPHKNIKKIMGKTLIEITAETAEKANKIDGIFFSSDSKEYIDIYKNLNLKKDVTDNYIRPIDISSDTASSFDYVCDCLKYLGNKNIQVKNFILLQVTSPLRQLEHINTAINMYDNKSKSLVSVCESTNHPYNSFFYDEMNKKYTPIIIKKSTRRQDYPKSVSLNGAIYIKNVDEYILHNGIIMTDTSILYIMDKISSIDIDDEDDYIMAKIIYENKS